MIISVLNQKGGAGKTTIAVNIAREYTKRSFKTLFVDSDQQGSALKWHKQHGGELIDLTCLPVNTLDKDVIKFKDRYNRIIIDGLASVSPLTVCAIKASDLVLIPVQPSALDVWSTEDLVQIVKERIEMTEGKLKAAFVISRRIQGTNIGQDIVKILEQFELPVLKSGTFQRIEYVMAFNEGRTVCELHTAATKEIVEIVNELEGFL